MFEQAKLKAKWAEHMIGQINEGVQRFASTQPSEVRSNHNTKTGELKIQIRGDPAGVPADIIMLAGTCVQTMLSCFDYITSEIWNSQKHTDTRIHFPIDVDDDQLKASGSYKKIAGAQPALAEFILNEIKPTKTGNFSIWALKRLANTDKHRNLLLAATWGGFEVDKIERSDGISIAKARFSAPAGSQNENHISIPNVKEYSKPYATMHIAIRETHIVRPDVFDRYELVETLSNFLRVTTETINSVEQFLMPEIREESKTV